MGGSSIDHARIIRLKRLFFSPLFRFSLGFCVSGLSLYFALRKVSFSDLWQAFSRSDLHFLFLALVSVAVNVLLKILRWKVLLGSSGSDIRLPKISMSFLAAQMLNTFVPIRAGEISRVYVIGKTGIGHAFVLGTIAVEKIVDMIAYTLLFILLLVLIPLPEWIGVSGATFVLSTFSISIMVFFAAFYRNQLLKFLDRVITWLPERYRSKFLHHLHNGLSSLDVLQNRVETIELAVATAIIWGTAILTNYLILLSLKIDLPITASLLVLIALQAGISIPSLPGKLGVFEYMCILALGAFGINQALALSYGILLHVIIYLPIVISGLLSYLLLDVGNSKGRAASATG
jgi:uncharacterized protein (TIRG00374 family)